MSSHTCSRCPRSKHSLEGEMSGRTEGGATERNTKMQSVDTTSSGQARATQRLDLPPQLSRPPSAIDMVFSIAKPQHLRLASRNHLQSLIHRQHLDAGLGSRARLCRLVAQCALVAGVVDAGLQRPVEAPMAVPRADPGNEAGFDDEIGRASCRERV